MFHGCLTPNDLAVDPVSRSPYDPLAIMERAQQWRVEARLMNLEALRRICLIEADECDRRIRLSLVTPVFREVER